LKLSPEEMQKAIEKYSAWRSKPFVKGSNRLADDPGKIMRGAGAKRRTTDGPYSEGKEVLGGYYLIEAANYEQAVSSLRIIRTWSTAPSNCARSGDRRFVDAGRSDAGALVPAPGRPHRFVSHARARPRASRLAEESVQDAMLRALQTWPFQGVPENAAAWLFRVAHNSALDALRHRRLADEKSDAILAEFSRATIPVPDDPYIEEQLRDDELRMIFMCCHPEFSPDTRVSLSLKTVGGLSVREIARAFLADEATVAQRLVRAKRQIRDRGLTLDMPPVAERRQRLDSVSKFST
jgi:RNA polymerase sigma factor (sigma-70 family)